MEVSSFLFSWILFSGLSKLNAEICFVNVICGAAFFGQSDKAKVFRQFLCIVFQHSLQIVIEGGNIEDITGAARKQHGILIPFGYTHHRLSSFPLVSYTYTYGLIRKNNKRKNIFYVFFFRLFL